MRYLLYTLLLCVMVPLGAVFASDDTGTGISYTGREYIITVSDRPSAVRTLIEKARAEKGVILFYSGNAVQMRIPVSRLDAIEAVIKTMGYIDDEKMHRADVGEELATLKANLAVKNDYITKLYKLTRDANLGGTLSAEKAIERASTERDGIRSSIRRLERMAKYSDITVTVNGPGEGITGNRSRFGFINSLGIENLSGDSK